MNWMSSNQQVKAVEFLAKQGWTFSIDRHDPRGEYRGWWLHSEIRPRRTGDSAKMHFAAEMAFSLAGYNLTELS